MAAPIKADIIYYASASDFELEFNLCGCCTMRLLSDKPREKSAFVHSLSRAVSRSQVIFAVGKAEGENAILPDLCGAIGYTLSMRDISQFGASGEAMLPDGAIPLISSDGRLGGCVMECGPQVIIVLTDDRELRRIICKDLVYGYVRDLASDIENAAASEREVSAVLDDSVSEGASVSSLEEINADEFDCKCFDVAKEPEVKEKKSHKGLRRLFIILFVLIFLAGGLAAYVFFAEPLVIKNQYKDYYETHLAANGNNSDGIIDSMSELHLQNSDTVGYIKIAGSSISCPVVTSVDKGEEYYKNHTFNGWYSLRYGTPYTKSDITPQTYYRNIIVYGQDTNSGIMFDGLSSLATVEGYRASPVISFDTLYSSDVYKVFAAFRYDGEVDDALQKTAFLDDTEFGNHLKLLLERSIIKTTVDVAASDEIITLISYGKDKTVVVARRLRAGESPLVDTQSAGVKEQTQELADISKLPHASISFLPAGNVPYKDYSEIYEQAAPLSPEQIALYAAQYAKGEQSEPTDAPPATAGNAMEVFGNKTMTVYDVSSGTLVSGTTYDILCQIVEAEMGSSYEVEALKAQTIASYGWLLTSGAETDGAPAVRLKAASNKTMEAVGEVIGIKPYFGNTVAHTMYFPCSAGYTARSASLYSYDLPYLAQSDSSIDRGGLSYLTHRVYKASDVQKWVLEETGIDLSSISDKNRWFNVTYDRMGNYAEQVWFGNSATIYGGRFLRECIFTSERVGGENTLGSAAYRITYQRSSDTFIFETKGIGHGLGMSQNGANRYAKEGMTYKEILSRYFSGITLDY